MAVYGAEYRAARRVLLADDPACWKCGAPATTADHVPPLKFARRAGVPWEGVLLAACKKCNFGQAADAAILPAETPKLLRNPDAYHPR